MFSTLSLSGFSGKNDGFALMFGTHPSPVSRIERLDKTMGSSLDALPVLDDLPQFAAVRARLGPPVAE